MAYWFNDGAYDCYPCRLCGSGHMTFRRETNLDHVYFLLGVDEGWGYKIASVVITVECNHCHEEVFRRVYGEKNIVTSAVRAVKVTATAETRFEVLEVD